MIPNGVWYQICDRLDLTFFRCELNLLPPYSGKCTKFFISLNCFSKFPYRYGRQVLEKKTILGLQLLDSLNYLKTNLHYYEPLTRLIEAIINRENNAERVLVIDHLKTLQVTGFPLGLYKWWESWLKQKQINFLDLLFAESAFYSFEKTQGKLCEL